MKLQLRLPLKRKEIKNLFTNHHLHPQNLTTTPKTNLPTPPFV